MTLTKTTYSMISGSPTNILDIIPQVEHAAILAGTSTYNCGPDILTAITTLQGSTTRKRLYFPKGIYVVSTQITISGFIGFVFYGDGPGSTILSYTPTSGSLFYITGYVSDAFYDMSFYSAAAGGTNIGFRLNGTGGGTQLLFQNCAIHYFGTAVQTKDAVGNDDTVTFNSCYFWYNGYVWDNTNTQAVSWTFNECQVLFNTNIVFYNPGGFMRVYGGTYINYGTLCRVDAVTGVSGLLFDGLKLEPYGPIPMSTKWLTIGGVSAVSAIFRGVNDTTGNPHYTTPTFELSNDFSIYFYNCVFSQGTMQILADFSTAARMSSLFVDNSSTPPIIETTFPGNGNLPVNKTYLNSANFNGSQVRYITTRSFAIPVVPTVQKLIITNSSITATMSFPFQINIPVNGSYTISGVDFYYYEPSYSIAATITLWTDSTKTVKIYEYVKAASSGTKVDSATLATLLNIYTLTSVSDPLLIEVTTASTLGYPDISMVLTLRAFN